MLEAEGNAGLGVDAEFFPVFNLGLGSVEHDEVGLEVLKLFLGGTNEHVGHEMCLPCNFHNETYGKTGVGVGSAESIDNIKGLVGKLLVGDCLESVPCFFRNGLVVILVFFGCPPDGVFRDLVFNEEFIFCLLYTSDAADEL